jgi:hypothetical protein
MHNKAGRADEVGTLISLSFFSFFSCVSRVSLFVGKTNDNASMASEAGLDVGSAWGEHRAVQSPAIGQEQNTRLSWGERE